MPHSKIDTHFLNQYRAMLDDEEAAFDDLEHDFEEGKSAQFAADVDIWIRAIEKRIGFLKRSGFLGD